MKNNKLRVYVNGVVSITGLIYDITGWYELSYMVLGCWQACGTALFLVVSILQWKKSKESMPIPNTISEDL